MANKDAYWFRHDSNAKDDPKCVMLIEQLGLEGYGIYWTLIEVLREQPGYTYPLNLVPALARRYNTTAEKMKAVIFGYDLFVVKDDVFFFSESLMRRMNRYDLIKQKRVEAAKIGVTQRQLQAANAEQMLSKCSTNAEQTDSKCLANIIDKNRIDKNRIKDNVFTNVNMSEKISDAEESQEEKPLFSQESSEEKEPEQQLLSNKQCQQVVDFWNNTIKDKGANFPKVVSLSEDRKKKIRVRWSEFSQIGDPIEVTKKLFANACESKFLQGDNNNGWSASFDWIFTNSKNWVKVYEGNYDNKAPSGKKMDATKDIDALWERQ